MKRSAGIVSRILAAALVFTAFPTASRAVVIANFPGLPQLIEQSDAIVILRIDRHVDTRSTPNLYTTHDCYIYQVLKGDLPAGATIRLQLLDTSPSLVTPYALGSTHLMFLTKKSSPNEPTDYRTIQIQGANIPLSPLGHEQVPKGRTVEEKIIHLIEGSIAYGNEQQQKEREFLELMIGQRTGDADSPGDGHDLNVELARSAAKAFCRKFGFPREKMNEMDGPPLSGPVPLERDGRQVMSYRWLGGGRGDYAVQAEVDIEGGPTVVYGGYNHNEFGPWVFRQAPFINVPPNNEMSQRLFVNDLTTGYITKHAGPIDNYDPRWHLGSCETASGVIHVGVFRINKQGKDYLIFFDSKETPTLIWKLDSDLRQFRMDGCKLVHLERAITHGDSQESASRINRSVIVDFATTEHGSFITLDGKRYALPNTQDTSEQPVGISTHHTKYRRGETVLVGISNNLEVPIFVSSTCGIPFTLQRKVDAEWKAIPLIADCEGIPFLKIEPSKGLLAAGGGYKLGLGVYEQGGGNPTKLSPGMYRLEMNYTVHQNPTLLGADPLFVPVVSNEFRLEE